MLRKSLVVLLAVLALSAVPSAAFAAPCQQSGGVDGTTSWTGGDGKAEDASKWSNGTPSGNCRAVIAAAGTYTVTVSDTSTSSDGIDLGASSGTQTLAIVGSTKMNGDPADVELSPTFDAGLPLTIGTHGVVSLRSSGTHPGGAILSGNVVNNGLIETIVPTAGVNNANTYRDIRANVTNNVGGQIAFHTDLGTCGCGSGGTWINHGTLTTDAGTTAVFSRTGAGVRFSQPAPGGTVVNHGRFEIDNGGFTNAAGTTSGNPLEICGDLDPSGPGAASFEFDNAVSDCPGPNVGALRGAIGAATTVLVHATTAAGVNLSTDAGLANNGTMTFDGGPGQLQLIGGTPFTNAGAMNVNAANAYFTDPVINTGSLSVGAGAGLLANGALTQSAGTFSIGAGATVTANGTNPFTLAGGSIVNGGALNATGFGDVSHTGGNATGNAIGFCNDTLKATGPGTAAFAGTCPQNQTLGSDIGAGDTVTLTTTGAQVDVFADSFTNRGSLAFQSSAGHLVQLHGDTLTNTGALTFTGSNVAMKLVNQGTLAVPAAAGLSTNSNQPVTQAAGTTTVDGALGTSSAVSVTGGTLKGIGTVTANVNNPSGTVHPGDSPGVLSIAGTYTQGTGGTLAVDIAGTAVGTGYSRLAVSGAATVAGTLAVANPVNTVGTFRVLTGGSVTGAFSALTFTGRTDTALYDGTGVTLGETAAPAVPAPAGPSGSGSPSPSPAPAPSAFPSPTASPSPVALTLDRVALAHGKLSLRLSKPATIKVLVSARRAGAAPTGSAGRRPARGSAARARWRSCASRRRAPPAPTRSRWPSPGSTAGATRSPSR